MTTHPNRSSAARAARAYCATLAGVQRIRVLDGEVLAYGTMPNTSQVGWYFAGSVDILAAMAVPKRVGRPLKSAAPLTERVELRLTVEQRDKLARLGGADWVRSKIDQTPQ